MITKNEQNQLKKIIGSHYSSQVKTILNKKKVRNKFGQAYSSEYIRLVFQGLRDNKEIEAAIWELAKIKQNKANQLDQLKSDLLNE